MAPPSDSNPQSGRQPGREPGRQPANQTDPSEGPKAVAVMGLGQMGQVCTAMLSQSILPTTPEIRLWGRNENEAGALTQTRRSDRLEGFVLDDAVRVTTRAEEALDGADLIVSAIPVQQTRSAWSALRAWAPPGAGVVSVAKGVETQTLRRPTQIIAEALTEPGHGPDNPDEAPRAFGSLSGPTIAAELARCLPATMTVAAEDEAFAARVQRTFSTSWLRVYTNPDLLGVEIAGATKNVIAIAAGILDGLQAGYNAKSALLARGLSEITRLGVTMGASPHTFYGIAGVGDLATTCFSPEGRNRSCGEALGRGTSLAAYLRESSHTVEGVETTRAVMALAERFRVEVPITEAVHRVLFEGVDPLEAISRLMARELKGEISGPTG